MADYSPPSVCTCCGPDVITCCPTLPETLTVSVSFSNPGTPPNNPGIAELSKSGCGYTGGINEDNPTPKYLAVSVLWVPDNPEIDPHIGHWRVGWDDYGYNDQYYGVEGPTDWCSPQGTYSGTCDSPLCLDPTDTSQLTIS